jgi:hypothetical protein
MLISSRQPSGFSPDALQSRIAHCRERAKLLCEWLAALDDFRNWLIREAA